jgi:hypothetical protein
MTTKKFIYKTIIKILIYAIISMIAIFILTNPIITNHIALGQMQNDDTLYLLMDAYYKIRPFVSFIYNCVTALFVGTIIYDTYKFIQTKKNKGEN